MFADLKYLKQHPFQLVSMIAIALIPLIYSAVFIGSMWNPYNETKSLTVDIVNKDDGAKINGEEINIGNKLEDKLKKNDKFNWQFHKDSKAAKQNIDKGKSFAYIEIPANTSKKASTLLDEQPEKANITVKTNPGYNYIGANIGGQSATGIQQKLSDEIRSTYTKEVFSNMKKLIAGNEQTIQALDDMNNAEQQLIDGNQQVQAGLEQLKPLNPNAVGQIAQGNTQVTDGLASLQENNEKLNNNLKANMQQSSDTHFEEKNAEYVADPINMKQQDVTEVENYGQSFAPYIISVSLFVGAITFSAVYPVGKNMLTRNSVGQTFMSKFLLYLIQSIVTSAILTLFLVFVFQIEIDDIVRFTTLIVLWGLASMFLVTTLTTLLGNVGKFLALMLLILQLGSSEGTFPIETSNGFFQFLNPILPMTYVIKGIRESIFGFTGEIPYHDAVIYLIVLIVVSLIVLFFSWMMKYKFPKTQTLD